MKIPKKYYFSLVILGIGLILAVVAIIQQKKKAIEIDKNKYSTIALVDTAKTKRTSSNIYYNFFFKGLQIRNTESIYKNNIENTIGKFYRVQVSTKNPSNARILLNAEVTDSTLIRAAGFLIDESN